MAVLKMVKGKPGQLMTLDRARMIVRCVVSFMVGCEFKMHPERGDGAYTYRRPPMPKADCISEAVSLMGHRRATIAGAYAAVVKGPEAVLAWYAEVITEKCARNGRSLQKLPQDMMICLDKVIQNEIIGKGMDLTGLAVVDEVAKLGLGISVRTARRTITKLGYKFDQAAQQKEGEDRQGRVYRSSVPGHDAHECLREVQDPLACGPQRGCGHGHTEGKLRQGPNPGRDLGR